MSAVRESGYARQALRRAWRGEGDPYAGADPRNATRLVGVLALLSATLAALYLPLDPPTEAIGAAGWPLAGAVTSAGIAGSLALLRRSEPLGFDFLLGISYLGLVQVLVLGWLAGWTDSAYRELTMLWIGTAAGIHPVRRALTFLAVAAVSAFAPLVVEGWTGAAAADTGADVILWVALGLVLLGLMTYVRAERVRLRDEEERAQELARADPLTGLGNRRAFDEALEAEIGRAQRASSTASVAMIDIDHLKQLNDRFGHLEGDRALEGVAGAITKAMRAGDRGFRWGGDEFAVILPDTDLEGAELALSRIADEICAACANPAGDPITVSWGAAELESGMGPTELLDHADLALMVRKRRRLGRPAGDPVSEDA
jgi:diguanylate cyclase (GGDEF)-like protein